MFVFHIQKVQVSNPSPETGYPASGLVFLSPPRQIPEWCLKLGQYHFNLILSNSLIILGFDTTHSEINIPKINKDRIRIFPFLKL
jgi:hypothetical protein